MKSNADHRREVEEFVSSLPPEDSFEGRLARFGVGLLVGALLAGFVWFVAFWLVEIADGPSLRERLGLAGNAPLATGVAGVALFCGAICVLRGDRVIAPLLLLIRKLGPGDFE